MKIILLALVFVACTDDDEPTIPTCAELGAAPDAPLFCTSEGFCTYDGMECRRDEEPRTEGPYR